MRRSYLLHGVGLEVSSIDPSVLDAIDLRFGGFAAERDGGSAHGSAEMEFEFATGRVDTADRVPTNGARPVYDTPFGSLYYLGESYLIYGELAGVTLRCEPGRGTATVHQPDPDRP